MSVKEYVEGIGHKGKRDYFRSVLSLVPDGGDDDKLRMAYHGSCPDGAITAAMALFLGEGEVFVPLDYSILKDAVMRKFLAEVRWHCIADLEPFNNHTLDLFVDHHRSVIGTPIKARRIHFESGPTGPSAASVFMRSVAEPNALPPYMTQLGEVSKITDTASFAVDPPLEPVEDPEPILGNFDALCWFIQDVCNLEDDWVCDQNNEVVRLMAKGGVSALFRPHLLKRVNKHRANRHAAVQFADNAPLSSVMVLTNAPNTAYKQALALSLGKKGVKVMAFLSEKEEGLVTVSLRQSKQNTPVEIENYRLDLLAKAINPSGGGHAEAAGSAAGTIEEATEVIKQWAGQKKLPMKVLECGQE